MKSMPLVITAMACLTVVIVSHNLATAQDGPAKAAQVGRYQLTSFAPPMEGDDQPTPGVYMIDTATSEVWRYDGRRWRGEDQPAD